MAKQFSTEHIEQMFKYIFEYSGFEVDGFDRQNRILAYPSSNNQIFAFPTAKDGQILEGVKNYSLNIMTPPEELLYCAKIILGEQKFKKMKNILNKSTFKEILDIIKPELWMYYSKNKNPKFEIFCKYTKNGIIKMITDYADVYDAFVQYDFYENGSANLKACWDNEETKYPQETFANVIYLANDLIKEKNIISVWFNKLMHKGEYEFSYRDSLKIYDCYNEELHKISC